MYFHHHLPLCCLEDTRESWELGNERERERKNPGGTEFVHSFIIFGQGWKSPQLFIWVGWNCVTVYLYLFPPVARDVKNRHSLPETPSSKALTHESTMKYEDAAISYLCLEMNWLDQADVSPQLQKEMLSLSLRCWVLFSNFFVFDWINQCGNVS